MPESARRAQLPLIFGPTQIFCRSCGGHEGCDAVSQTHRDRDQDKGLCIRKQSQLNAKCRFSIAFTDVTPNSPMSRLISLVMSCNAWATPG